MCRIIISTAFIALFVSITVPYEAAAFSPFAHPPASYLLQINGHTYRQKSPDVRRAPASLTKVMTALIVLENASLDEVVTVSSRAARETGSRIGLRKGEKLSVRALLAASLIASANDASRALADHVAGNQKDFVAMMNAKARSLHLRNTRFSNVCGHDQNGHYTTANDLLVITKEALNYAVFAKLVATPAMRITTTEKRSYTFRNKNRLIGRYPGAKGVKTGTTPNAGQCLIALAQRDDKKVILVMMKARRRWVTAPALLDAAFAAPKKEIGGRNAAVQEGALVRNAQETGLHQHHAAN